MSTQLLRYQELITQAETWLNYSAPSSTEFSSTGNKIVEGIQALIRSLTPYSSHAVLGPLLATAKDVLEKVLINLAKKAPTSTTSPAPEAASSVRRQAPYSIKAPTFSGKPMDFPQFYERFTEVIKTHWEHYTDGDRCCLLADAMTDPSARELVEDYSSTGYDSVLKQLKDRYGRASAIFPRYVEDLVTRARYSYTQESMMQIIKRVEHTLEAMAKVKGATIGQVAVALAIRDFDDELAKEWAKHLGPSDQIPDVADLMKFVRPLSHNLPSKPKFTTSSQQQSSKHHKKEDNNNHNKKAAASANTSPKNCPLCKGPNHGWTRCQVFQDADNNQRWQYVRQHKYCANCLHGSHQVGNCASTYTCHVCQSKHHSLLHKGDDSAKSKQSAKSLLTSAKLQPQQSLQTNSSTPKLLKGGFIHTALLTVFNGDRAITVRAAIDSCSTHSIMTEKVASYLHVTRFPISVQMTGSVSSATLKHGTTIGIRPAFPSPERVELDVAITPLPFSSTPPDNTEDVVNNPILRGIRLADGELGGPIDLIVGTYDQPHFLLNDPLKSCLQSRITAVSTIFGWTVAGPSTDGTITTLSVELQQNNLDTLLTRMYLLEKVPAVSRYSPEEESALHQFRHTVQVQADGHYSVSLPRVDNPPALGKSRKMATSRFLSNERSLKKKDRLQSFNKEMASYLELKHAEVVPEPELGNDHYYLPVHGVFKDHSTTTKVRPVFDGSARTSTGASLNDLLLPGPNLYPHIEDILLMFRLHPIAFSADISKMFREIQLHSPERDLHRFLTRDSSGTSRTAG